MKKFIHTTLGKVIIKLLNTAIGKLIVEEILRQFKLYLIERIDRSNTGMTEQARFYAQNIINTVEPKDFLNRGITEVKEESKAA